MSELGEEKIDIISFSEDPARFIAAALSPAKDIQVRLNEKDEQSSSTSKVATVTVPQSQLSLAIGKGGQNVRLAAKLTGWKIDIEGAEEEAPAEKGTAEKKEEPSTAPAQAAPPEDQQQTEKVTKEEVKEEKKETESQDK